MTEQLISAAIVVTAGLAIPAMLALAAFQDWRVRRRRAYYERTMVLPPPNEAFYELLSEDGSVLIQGRVAVSTGLTIREHRSVGAPVRS